MEHKDEDLIQQYLQGDQKAFEMIFQRHKLKIFNYAFRLLSNRADAEDVTADVFMSIVRRQYAYQPEVKFTTWLYTVVRNACLDRIRRRRKTISLWFKKSDSAEYEQLEVEDEAANPSDHLSQKDYALRVQAAIDKLPLEQKEAIILREYQELSYLEIGRILDCSVSNVKILIFRARERLKGELSAVIKEGL